MNKEIKKIFVVLACYALSGGIFYNFLELWLTDNNMSTKTIGILMSLCALLSVSVIFLCSNLIDKRKLKKFTCILLFLKFLILLALFFLNNSGLNIIIKFLIMLDFVIDAEIYACIYPMITLITKKDKLYALRGLIYSYAYYAGVLFTSFLLGKSIAIFNINFNTYCLIGSVAMFLSFIIMIFTNIEKYYKNDSEEFNSNNTLALNNVVKIVKKDKISQNYLCSVFFGDISYACANALTVILLTESLGFSAPAASNFKLIIGIIAVFIGTLILEKLTLKNNYINYSIKYVIRFLLYFLAALTNYKAICLIAIIFVRILSESYSHISDAPFINRFGIDNQLAFSNFKEMIGYLGESIGSFLCGIALSIGMRFNFIFATVFIVFQIIFWFNAEKLRLKEKGEVNL